MNEELTDFEGCCGLNIVSGFPEGESQLIETIEEQLDIGDCDDDYKRMSVASALKKYDPNWHKEKSNVVVLNNRQISLGLGKVLTRQKYELIKTWKSRTTSSTLYLYFRR